MLEELYGTKGLHYTIIAVDLVESRRQKVQDVISAISSCQKLNGHFLVEDVDGAKVAVQNCTGSVGCNAILEVSTSFQ